MSGITQKGDACITGAEDDASTGSARLLQASGRENWGNSAGGASTIGRRGGSLLWPAAAGLVITIGVLAGLELGRDGRIASALAMAGALAFFAGAGTHLLVAQRVSAQRLALKDSLTGLPNRVLLDDRIDASACSLAPVDRVVRALRRGSRRLQGRQRHPGSRGRERRLRGDRAPPRVGRPRRGHGGASGRRRVRRSSRSAPAPTTRRRRSSGRLRQALRRPYRVEGGVVELDASIGWAIFPQDGVTPADLLARADGQMYATKRDSSDESAVPRVPLDGGVVRDLESALEHGELAVHYQPIVDIRSGAVRGVEALVRRVRADRLVAPSEFVPHIERTPLVRKLTLAVTADALARLAEWDAVGHRLDAAVNVPYRMLDDPALVVRHRRAPVALEHRPRVG